MRSSKLFCLAALTAAVNLVAAACSKDSDQPLDFGSGGAGDGGTSVGGTSVGGGETGGSPSGGESSVGEGGASDQCKDCSAGPTCQACDWQGFDGRSCDETCCDNEPACVQGRCLDLCGQQAEDIHAVLAPDIQVLAQFCRSPGQTVVLRNVGGCEMPVVYGIRQTGFRQADEPITWEITRTALRPHDSNPSEQVLHEVQWMPPEEIECPCPIYNFDVNPTETKALFSVSHGSLPSHTLEVSLMTGALRSFDVPNGARVWLDEHRVLQRPNTVRHIDTSQDPPVVTELTAPVGSASASGPFGLLPGNLFVVGERYATPTEWEWAVMPVAMIQEIVDGTIAAFNPWTSLDVQRLTRESELGGDNIVGGRWLIAPDGASQNETRAIYPLVVADGVLSIGSPSPLIQDSTQYGFTRYAGEDRLFVATAHGVWQLITAPPSE